MEECDHDYVVVGEMDTDSGKKMLSVCNKCGAEKVGL